MRPKLFSRTLSNGLPWAAVSLAPRSRSSVHFVYPAKRLVADMHVTQPTWVYRPTLKKFSAGFPTWFVVVILGPTFHFHLSPDIHRGFDELGRHRIQYLRFYAGVKAQGLTAASSVLVEATALRRVVCPHRHPRVCFLSGCEQVRITGRYGHLNRL